MYNSLKNLPNGVVLDTNVCLNAAFVPTSVSYGVVGRLRALGFAPLLSKQIINECEDQLGSIALSTQKLDSVIKHFRSWVKQENLPTITVPDVTNGELEEINKRDRSVVKAMIETGSWLLTNDAQLFVEVKSIGGEPRFTWDVAIESELKKGNSWPLWATVRPHPMRRQQGSIFVRFDTGWGSDQVHGKTPHLVEIDGLMSVFYDGNTGRIVARFYQGAEVSMPIEISVGEMQTVLVNYSQPGRLQLRAAGIQAPVQADLGDANEVEITEPLGQMHCGHDRHSNNQINGHLRALVTHPMKVSGDRWRTYLSIPNASPNPWDELSLAEYLRCL